jgi:hypothetical protein
MAYDATAGYVILFGGVNQTTVFGDTWIWDGIPWTDVTPVASPSARWFHSMAYDGSNATVVLFGGTDGTPMRLSDTWTWNANTSTWTPRNPITSPPNRKAQVMAYHATSNAIVLFGGDSYSSMPYPGDTWTWFSNLDPPPRKRK